MSKITHVYLLTLSVMMEYSMDCPTPTSFFAPMCRTYLVLGRKFSSFTSSSTVKTKRLNQLSGAPASHISSRSLKNVSTNTALNSLVSYLQLLHSNLHFDSGCRSQLCAIYSSFHFTCCNVGLHCISQKFPPLNSL